MKENIGTELTSDSNTVNKTHLPSVSELPLMQPQSLASFGSRMVAAA